MDRRQPRHLYDQAQSSLDPPCHFLFPIACRGRRDGVYSVITCSDTTKRFCNTYTSNLFVILMLCKCYIYRTKSLLVSYLLNTYKMSYRTGKKHKNTFPRFVSINTLGANTHLFQTSMLRPFSTCSWLARACKNCQ